MKTALVLTLLAIVLPSCWAEAEPAQQKAKIKVADLNGVWVLSVPLSDNGQLLNINNGTIEGSKIKVAEYFKTGKGKTLAFRAKIKAITPTRIDLEQDGPQPKSDLIVPTAPYDFELRQEATGEVMLWIDLLRRPELKAAGFWYRKLQPAPEPKEKEKPKNK